ncbi:MAG TPA: PTS sugar transporter subunit IIA [Enhygromyxa sp.]|nr:PTS sugar transporter subunit IIA [Enhygromyxa sp.]
MRLQPTHCQSRFAARAVNHERIKIATADIKNVQRSRGAPPVILKMIYQLDELMTIEDIIPDESAILELRGQQAAEVLVELAAGLARRSGLDEAPLLERLRAREALGSTAIGRGLALPHTKADVRRTYGVLGVARAGVDFEAPDGVPVRVLLALVSPSDPSEHLRALACVSRSFADPGMVEQLIACADTSAMLALLRGELRC